VYELEDCLEDVRDVQVDNEFSDRADSDNDNDNDSDADSSASSESSESSETNAHLEERFSSRYTREGAFSYV
jgi:hypothetical protein